MSSTAMFTVLFTDLVDSTGILSRLGEDAAEELSRAHLRQLRTTIAECAGEEVRSEGDGMVAVFASATGGCAAAVAMQRAVLRLNRLRAEVPLSMRVGMSLGEMSREDGDWFGTPVVEAARLCSEATGGQILISDVVRAVAGTRGGFDFRRLAERQLKGFAHPTAVAELVWEPAEAEVPLHPVLTAAAEGLFIGRSGESEQLLREWKMALGGSRRTVLLAGEPGIGKTRLAASLASHASQRGATVLYGRCDEDLDTAYQPFADALRQFLRARPNDLRSRLGPAPEELARLAPDVSDFAGPHRLATVEGGDHDRLPLFDAISGWLEATSRVAPVLLILDDLHWAASPTLLLLRHLAKADPMALLVLGTYRNTEVVRGSPLSNLLADLRRDAGVERINLRGLDVDEVTDFARARGPERSDPVELGRAIHAETKGNPFFAGELLRHLSEAPSDAAALTLPASIRDVVQRRLGRLGGAVAGVLTIGAVIGPEFDLTIVEAVADLAPPITALDALERCVHAGLVEEVEGSPGRHRFVHALVRQTLLDELTAARRARVHRLVGEAIEARLTDIDPVMLAYHFGEAALMGEAVDRALLYAEQAAHRMLEQLAYEPAVAQLERAVALVGSAAHRRLAGLLIALGDARWRVGDGDGARRAALEAAASARAVGAIEALSDAALCYGRLGVTPGVVDSVLVELLEEALSQLPEDAARARSLAAGRLAMELYYSAERDRRSALGDVAVDVARALGDAGVLARALDARRFATWSPDTLVDRLATSTELVQRAIEAREPELVLQGRVWRIVDLLESGALDEVDRELALFEEAAAQLRQPTWLWYAAQQSAMRLLLSGRFDIAEASVTEAFAAGSGSQAALAFQSYGIQLFVLRWEQGRLEELAPVFSDFVASYPTVPAYEAGLALLHVETGQLDDARAILDRLTTPDLPLIPNDANRLVACALLSKVAAQLGSSQAGTHLAQALAPFADHHIVLGPRATVSLGSARAFIAEALFAAGRYDEAVAEFDSAARANAAVGAVAWADHARLGAALSLVARAGADDADRAGQLARAVATSAEDRGQVRLAALAAATATSI